MYKKVYSSKEIKNMIKLWANAIIKEVDEEIDVDNMFIDEQRRKGESEDLRRQISLENKGKQQVINLIKYKLSKLDE